MTERSVCRKGSHAPPLFTGIKKDTRKYDGRGERGARARECESEAIDVGGCGKIRGLVVKICRFIGKYVLF